MWQNLWVAQNSPGDVARQGFLPRWFGATRRTRKEIAGLLEFADLAHKGDELASNLAFGEQRAPGVRARAAAARPTLLLLDEPAAGMSRQEIDDLGRRIRRVRDSGVTILLVEHVMELVMDVTERIAVLNFGHRIAFGTRARCSATRRCRRRIWGRPPRSPFRTAGTRILERPGSSCETMIRETLNRGLRGNPEASARRGCGSA